MLCDMCMLLCYVRYHALERVCFVILGIMLCDMCMLLCYVRYHALERVCCVILGIMLCDMCILLRALEHVCAAVCFQVRCVRVFNVSAVCILTFNVVYPKQYL